MQLSHATHPQVRPVPFKARSHQGSATPQSAVTCAGRTAHLKKLRPYVFQCCMAMSSTVTSLPPSVLLFLAARMDSHASTAQRPSFSRTWSLPVPKDSSPHTEQRPAVQGPLSVGHNGKAVMSCPRAPHRAAASKTGAVCCGHRLRPQHTSLVGACVTCQAVLQDQLAHRAAAQSVHTTAARGHCPMPKDSCPPASTGSPHFELPEASHKCMCSNCCCRPRGQACSTSAPQVEM